MAPLLIRSVTMLVVVLAVGGLFGQAMGKKTSEVDFDADADAEDDADAEADTDADTDAEDQAVDILALTADSFLEQVDSDLPLLVYYYTKWCKHCMTTWPMIEALAVLLRDRDDLALTVAKMDVEADMDFAREQGVTGFPTIRMYRAGRRDEFYGERSVPNLVQWLEHKMGLAMQRPRSAQEARRLIAAHPVVLMGFFQDVDSEEAVMFKASAEALDKVVFALVDDEQLIAELGGEDGSVVVFKKFDEGRAEVRLQHSADTLQKALQRAARPLVTDFRSDEAHVHFAASGNANRSVFVAFLSRRAGHYELLHDTLQAVALERSSNVTFLSVDADKADNAPALAAFALTNETALPAMRMYSFASGKRFRPSTDRMSADAVRDFIAGVHSGVLKAIDALVEAPEPEPVVVEKGVQVLSSATFDQHVYDGRRHALVMFHAENCPHCVTFKPIFEEVAGHLAGQPSLSMAKIDMGKYKPKSPGIDVVSVPYVVMYPRCAKEKPVAYDGARSAKALLKFVKKHTGLEVPKSRSAKGKSSDEQREEL